MNATERISHALFTNRGVIAARFYSIRVADVFGWNRGAKTAARVIQ
jgi:hypothetical protein